MQRIDKVTENNDFQLQTSWKLKLLLYIIEKWFLKYVHPFVHPWMTHCDLKLTVSYSSIKLSFIIDPMFKIKDLYIDMQLILAHLTPLNMLRLS